MNTASAILKTAPQPKDFASITDWRVATKAWKQELKAARQADQAARAAHFAASRAAQPIPSVFDLVIGYGSRVQLSCNTPEARVSLKHVIEWVEQDAIQPAIEDYYTVCTELKGRLAETGLVDLKHLVIAHVFIVAERQKALVPGERYDHTPDRATSEAVGEVLREQHELARQAPPHPLGLSEEDLSAELSLVRVAASTENPLMGFRPANQFPGLSQLHRLEANYTIDTAWDTTDGMLTLFLAMQTNRHIAITGAMGTGKTKAVLAAVSGKSVLYVVPSRALGEQIVKFIPDSIYATEIAGISAQGPVGKDGTLYKSVVACTPSLYRIADAKFDVVVIDEAMGATRQLHNSELCADRRPQLIGSLARAVEQAAMTIVMDANLTPHAMWLLGMPRTAVTCHTTHQPMPCAVSILQGSRMAAMGAIVKAAQTSSEKIVVHVDSTLIAESLDKLCYRNNVTSLVVSAETKTDHQQSYFLTDTAMFWAIRPDVQVVIATNVLSCGYSIEGAGAAPIGQVWGIYQGANGQTPDDYAQSLFRVRSNAPRFVWAAKGCSGFATIYKQGNSEDAPLAAFTSRTRREQAKMRDFLLTYLATQGCTLELLPVDVEQLDLTDVGTAAQKQTRIDRLKAASVINVFEYEELKKSRYPHSTQKRAMARFEWVQRFGSDLTEAQWALAASGAFKEKTALAHYLMDLELAQSAACPDEVFHKPRISTAASWVVGGLTSHPLMMAYMGPVFGLLKGDHEDASGEGEVWAAFNEGAADIAANFRLTAKSNQDLLGKLLAMVGIKRSRKKRSDQSWAYSLDTEHWTVWKSFVQAGNAVVEGVRETVKKIQAACATSRAALGMVAYEVANKLVAMVLPERTAEVVDEAEEWSAEVEAYQVVAKMPQPIPTFVSKVKFNVTKKGSTPVVPAQPENYLDLAGRVWSLRGPDSDLYYAEITAGKAFDRIKAAGKAIANFAMRHCQISSTGKIVQEIAV
jgi:Origin of replication binding protein